MYSLIWSAFINHFTLPRFLDWTRRAPNTSTLDMWLTFLLFHMVSGSWLPLLSRCYSLTECTKLVLHWRVQQVVILHHTLIRETHSWLFSVPIHSAVISGPSSSSVSDLQWNDHRWFLHHANPRQRAGRSSVRVHRTLLRRSRRSSWIESYWVCFPRWLCSSHSFWHQYRYNKSDVEMLVEGTLPQRRVLDLAPGIGDVIGSDGKEHLLRIMERSLEY